MPKHQRSPIELEADQQTGRLENAKRSPHSPTPRSAASAPAKLILCGEHAVVYGRPAIALPLAGIRASVEVADRHGSGIVVLARDLRRRWRVTDEPNNPLSELITNLLAYLETHPLIRSPAHPLTRSPDLRIAITSTIPIASGMGSGAAVATALVRALAAHLGRALPPAEISALVYASEQRYHGTPSGIDNTVIAYEQPIWFQRTKDERRKTEDEEMASDKRSSFVLGPSSALIEPATIAQPFTLLIADTGVRSATRLPVGEVRQRWQAAPARYEALFSQIGDLVVQVRVALAKGDILALGPLLSRNHALLQQIGVSSPELDVLVAAAQASGALGAKLSGAGWGGVMLALVTPAARECVAQALAVAGAKRVIETTILQHSAEHNSI
jgi:mevalonate kinase